MSFLLFGAQFLTREFSGMASTQCPDWIHYPSTTLSSIAEAVKDFKGKMIFVDLFTSALISSPSDLRTYRRNCKERAENYVQELSILKEHPDKEVIIVIFWLNLIRFYRRLIPLIN